MTNESHKTWEGLVTFIVTASIIGGGFFYVVAGEETAVEFLAFGAASLAATTVLYVLTLVGTVTMNILDSREKS